MPHRPTSIADDANRRWVHAIARAIFRWRLSLLVLFALATAGLGWSANHLSVQAGFSKMLPLQHPYIKDTFLKYQSEFGGANRVLLSLRARHGDIFNRTALDKLKALHEDAFYLHGAERSSVMSLYSPSANYLEVVEDGFRSGPVLPSSFDASPQSLDELRANLLKSQWVGQLVANDFSSAMVTVTLLERDPDTGAPLDLRRVGADLEQIRARVEDPDYAVDIIGFAKSSSDIADGARGVVAFSGIAVAITAALLYWYCGSVLLTVLSLVVAAVPVTWLLGLLPLVGLALDPMSILVPFLVFSIGVSHAVQMTNAWRLETQAGADAISAARNAFVQLFVPGASALLANAIGFLVIAFVQIAMVRELVITATLGVSLMIVTNKVLLPVLLSYVPPRVVDEAPRAGERLGDRAWQWLAPIATRKRAVPVIALACVLLALGLWKVRDQVIGDLGRGVPELRADSRYNRDVEAITRRYSIGVDVLQVIVQGDGPASCSEYEVLDAIDRFEFAMRQTEGVQTVRGLAGFVKQATVGFSEGDAKWATIPDTREQRNQATGFATRGGSDLINRECSAMNVSIFTTDHQARTLAHVVAAVKDFKARFDSPKAAFLLASGNGGVMAATNEVVAQADHWVNLALFGAVTLLCLATFRSLRITACIVLPLGLVTVLCYALMAVLGIGMKVNTLPVAALGVGVGVDYGIYLFEIINHQMRHRGASLQQAFHEALRQRGTASIFTALTMSIGVTTWAFSDLKFQADMGILLAFMFLLNALGAILLLPALASFFVKPVRSWTD